MAIATTNGLERDLGGNVTRRMIVLADISTASELVPASSTSGKKRRIVYAQLDFGAAGTIEIKAGSNPKVYKRLGGASVVAFGEEDQIESAADGSLSVEGSAAMTCDGYLDYIETR